MKLRKFYRFVQCQLNGPFGTEARLRITFKYSVRASKKTQPITIKDQSLNAIYSEKPYETDKQNL